MLITIDFKTPTVNHLYGRNGNRTFMKPEAKLLREDIIGLINPYYGAELKGKLLTVHVDIYENWFNKDGSVKRKDVSNREKFLIDSVFEGLGIDDKFIFRHTMAKVQEDDSSKEKAIVTIEGDNIYV